MGQLKINQNLVNAETAKALTAVCPFGAISYDGTKLEISAACKMCKLCVKKGPKGVMEFVEGDVRPTVDKSLWRGVCVFVDHDGDKIHRVTYELLGKARELADRPCSTATGARGDSPDASLTPVKCPEQAHASRASARQGARSGAPAEIDLSTVFAVGELIVGGAAQSFSGFFSLFIEYIPVFSRHDPPSSRCYLNAN